MKHLITAFKSFFLILKGKGENITTLLLDEAKDNTSAQTTENKAAYEFKTNNEQFNNGALYMLHLLQREGRLIDFLNEDISNFNDAQVGAAVRLIHQNCHKALTDYVSIEKIVSNITEGNDYSVQKDEVDNNLFKFTGNVPSQAPYKGILEHQGWKVSKANLPQINDSFNCSIIQTAEINCQ